MRRRRGERQRDRTGVPAFGQRARQVGVPRPGDAICADTQAELARLQPKIEEAQTASEDRQTELLAEIWREQIRILDSFSSEIKALGAPPGDEARVREFVRSLDEGERLGREITSHVEDGEEPPQSLMNDYVQAAYRGNALARAYGFKVCGKGSG